MYSPFGATSYVSNAAGFSGQDIRFPGQWFQLETGLAYNWHRHYDASIGRYVQPDPLGLTGGRNLYAYADASPLAKIDPDGQFVWVIPAFIPSIPSIIPAIPWIGSAAGAAGIGWLWWNAPPNDQPDDNIPDKKQPQRPSKTPNEGEPGSCHVNPGSGQERTYGPDGQPLYDVDYDHDHGQGVPHAHNWVDGIRGEGYPVSPWPRGRVKGF
ncbi:RHS repeat-associated core domain-containing protein [Methylocystis parvus]|uniref:RHS repeat-associated core domain-containing protein n=1 Tax=Methylocystis parvus TaxID=134 RepID=UPI0023DD995F|nr:RHS repeat-associated core domain-containing protein [Methylocystis parvus]